MMEMSDRSVLECLRSRIPEFQESLKFQKADEYSDWLSEGALNIQYR